MIRSALLTIALLFAPVLAAAQDGVEAEARELFEAGLAAAERGDPGAAVDLFQRSYELFPHPGTLLNVALYRREAGRPLGAYQAFTELLERFGPVISAETRERARTHLSELEEELATVEVATDPPGATLRLDDREVGVTPLPEPLRLEPGDYRLEARLEGYEPTGLTLELTAGLNPLVELTLREIPPEAPEPTAPAPDEPERSFWRGPWPWVIGGLLLLGAGVGLTVGLWPDDDPSPVSTLRFR